MMTDIYGIIKTFGAAVLTAAAAFAISACSMEESGPAPVEEGRPVEATLSFSSNDITETVVTKSNSYSRLASLILFIYNSDGDRCEQIVETADGSLVLDGSATNSEGIVYTAKFTTTTGTKRICALGNYESDNNWEYYDMSGIGTDGFDPENPDRWGNFSEYVSALREGAGNGMSSADLGRSLFFLEREFSQRGNTPTFDEQQMIMTGADVVTIGIDGKVTGDPNGNLYLERCIADIQFKIAQEYKNQDNHTVTFSASNYYVYNIAGGTRLAPGRGIETNPNESYREFYFDGSRKPISPATGGEYSFQFFVPENIQETLTTGTDGSGEQFDFTTEGSEGYQLREKWEGYDTYTGKETHKLWKNAPLNATYVVIEGQYSEMDSDNNLVYTGAVSYTIHLGNFGPGRWGDFTIERNHRYIYNVTVQGINSIEVEATTDVENQPGAEGSIVSTSETTKNYALDAHYEQVLLEYDLSAIAKAARATQDANTGMSDAEAISEHLIVTVDTPFQDGLKEIRPYRTFMQYYSGNNYREALESAKKEDLADADYKWVEFWPQTADGTDLEAYPGLPSWKNASGQDARENSKYLLDVYDACVKMGQVVEKIMNGSVPTYYGRYGGSGVREESKDDGRGITVFRVRTGGTTWNPSYSYYARFTGFVDEYYYTSNPITSDIPITWGDFANMPQRRMLISMDVQTSADGNSSFSNVHTNISQRSMQTFYNTDAATGLNAFGLETFNETPLSSYGSPKANGTSDTDGRLNQRALIGTYGWNYYINTGSNGYTDNVTGTRKLTEAYRQGTSDRYNTVRAYSACLSRNRDLDGDNSIDDDEIRWYLPAINEYLRIGMGTIAMSNESNLYIGDKSQMQRGPDYNGDGWPDDDSWYPENYHNNGALYHTSTNGKQTFWAVEKGAYGGTTSGDIPIRCIRHLPADLEDNSIPADPMFDLYTIKNGSHLLDFRGKFDNNMYRPTRTDTHLNEHNEDDLQNRFYDGLVISQTAQTNTAKLEAILNIGNNQTNPCADYYEGSANDPVSGKGHWRVPNLAELTVMASNPDVLLTGYNQIPYLYCCTRFSNEKVRIAFRFDGTQISCLGDKGERVDGDYQERYRCVRDATDRDFAEADPVY